MEQLLSIKHIPIKIEVNVTDFQYKAKEPIKSDAPAATVSRQESGAVQVAAQPYKVSISQNYDTFSPAKSASNSLKLTYNAVAKMSSPKEGASLPAANKSVGGQTAVAAKGASRSIESILSSLPHDKSRAVSYNNGTLSINYSASSKDSSVSIADLSSGFEFIPGSIEFEVSQMPELEIEYLGEPIYFPRSADPNYEGQMNLTI